MLKPIPAKILTHTADLLVCSAIDEWQSPTQTTVTLSNICIQPMHETRMTKDNTEVALSSVAFIDARLSTPAGYDFQQAQDLSEANGAPLELIYQGRTYTVLTVDTLVDDTGAYHHTELGLV